MVKLDNFLKGKNIINFRTLVKLQKFIRNIKIIKD